MGRWTLGSIPMTLILAVHSGHSALHVSDRMVSRGSTPFDPLANKTVVYAARRGIITIGTAGLAFLAGKTMDRWVAETLTGLDLSEAGVIGLGSKIMPSYDVGQAIERLRAQAEIALSREPPRDRSAIIEFLIIGSQWDRRNGRTRPVLCKISNVERRNDFKSYYFPRYRIPPSGLRGAATGIDVQKAHDFMWSDFANRNEMDVAACIDLMVEAVREVANRHPNQVGRDVMAVDLDCMTAEVTISFRPDAEQGALLAEGATRSPIAFTPYVIAPGGVASPALSSNALYFPPSGIDVCFDGGPKVDLGERPAAIRGQDRPTWRR